MEFTIPEAQTKGVELEAYFAATPDLTLNGGVTYAADHLSEQRQEPAVLQAPGSNLFLLPGAG